MEVLYQLSYPGGSLTVAQLVSPSMEATGRPSSALRDEVAGHSWYHSLDLGDGVRTKGMFDHAPVLDCYPMPADLSGRRCLDVGTMDGFWAFEMERRGAESVTAIDVEDPEALDWPASLRAQHDRTMDETKAERFALAKRALGSSVERRDVSVYDLGPTLGSFDFVFCGDLLNHLRDPVGAVEAIHSVCTGTAVIVAVIARFRFGERRALASLDGVETFTWWTPNLAGLVRIVEAAGFSDVEAAKPFELPASAGGDWRGLRGAVTAHP
jgi:tRNA (mo5U34)-methyltransferase